MSDAFDVSVVLCTYNRGEMLRPALESLAAQNADHIRFEVVVVDNNSTDETAQVIRTFLTEHADWTYVFESHQGLSYARNAGIAHARAPIVAFTDDDVRVAPDWVAQIKRSLDEHPEVDFVGGRVFPRWNTAPPAWLTQAHWIPLAVVDHGDEPFYLDLAKPWCMVGANLSVRKHVLVERGGFSAQFQRVKDAIGSTEDHEFQLRLWRSGRRGMYVPTIVVEAEVQNERLRKTYHRRWHSGHARFCAMMGTDAITDDMPELFGVPACFLRDICGHALAWASARASGQEDRAFLHENKIRFVANYVRAYNAARPQRGRAAVLARTARDIAVLARRKLGPASHRPSRA